MEEALGEAKNQISATKKVAQVAKAWVSKSAIEEVKAFRVGKEYRQEVLVSYKDIFLQGFKLCKT